VLLAGVGRRLSSGRTSKRELRQSRLDPLRLQPDRGNASIMPTAPSNVAMLTTVAITDKVVRDLRTQLYAAVPAAAAGVVLKDRYEFVVAEE
jgi:hypothetical protein